MAISLQKGRKVNLKKGTGSGPDEAFHWGLRWTAGRK